MILVDSSAWIEYYRRGGSREVRDAVFSAIRDNRAATNGVILVEVVAYAARDADSANVRSDLSGCHWLELATPVFELAVAMGRTLRTARSSHPRRLFRITVRKTSRLLDGASYPCTPRSRAERYAGGLQGHHGGAGAQELHLPAQLGDVRRLAELLAVVAGDDAVGPDQAGRAGALAHPMVYLPPTEQMRRSG